MATLTIEIEMDNAAFGDGDPADRSDEVDYILLKIIGDTVYEEGLHLTLFDSNGNRAGFIRVLD